MIAPRLIAATALTLIAAAPITAQQRTDPSGDVKNGAIAYRTNGCWACHGTAGHGGAWQGPKLAPDPMPYDGFIAQIREPSRSMPRYSAAVLSDRDVADIYAYLRTIPPGKPAAQIRMLNR